jgi:hypothetical protein
MGIITDRERRKLIRTIKGGGMFGASGQNKRAQVEDLLEIFEKTRLPGDSWVDRKDGRISDAEVDLMMKQLREDSTMTKDELDDFEKRLREAADI